MLDDETLLSSMHSFVPTQDRGKEKRSHESGWRNNSPKARTYILDLLTETSEVKEQPKRYQHFPWSEETPSGAWELQRRPGDAAKIQAAREGIDDRYNALRTYKQQELNNKEISQPISQEEFQQAVEVLNQSVLNCMQLFTRARMKDALSSIMTEIDNQEARFKIWQASYMPLILNRGHKPTKDIIDIFLGILRRLATELEVLVEKKQIYYTSTATDNSVSSSSSRSLLMLDSTSSEAERASETRTKTISKESPLARQLRRVNRMISRLYRYSHALYQGKTAHESIPVWPYSPWILEQSRARVDWCIQLQFPRLSRTSPLYKRFVTTCEQRTRRLSTLAAGADMLASLLQEREDAEVATRWSDFTLDLLRPYICTFSACESTTQFSSLSSWHAHMSRHKRILFYCPFPHCKHSSTPLPTALALHSHLSTAHADTVPSALVDALTSRGACPVPDLLLSLLQDWTTELSNGSVIWPLGRRRVVLCPLCPRPYLSINAAYGSPLYKAVIERDAEYVVPGEMADRIWRHLRYHLESVAVLAHPEFVMPGRQGKKAHSFPKVPGRLEGGVDVSAARSPASLIKGYS